MSIPLTITSLTNISFSKLFKVFKSTNTIENNIELGDYIRNDTIIYDFSENNNIPTTKTNIELHNFLNTIYISPQETIDLTIPNSYINTLILPGTTYINNFNLYDYLQTLDVYSIRSNLLELIINLNLSGYQFVDNTSNGAFVINMDDFSNNFDKLRKITINNDMYITGKHGGRGGNSIVPLSNEGKGGAGENGTDGGYAVVINSTQSSSISVEIIDKKNKIIGGFGAQGGNGGNGGTKDIYLYFNDPQYSISRVQGGVNGRLKLTFTNDWVETVDNPYHPHAEDNQYHIIRSGEMVSFGIYVDRRYVDSGGRILFYLYNTKTYFDSTKQYATFFNGQNATNGHNATNPSIGVHNADNPFVRNTPLPGNKGSLIDGYYNSNWTSDGGDPGTNGEDGETHSYDNAHINVNYITS